MVTFNTEYIPELEWTMVEPTTEINGNINKKIIELKIRESQSNISDLQHNNIMNDYQSILYLIKLIKKMIKYNSIYYKRIEKRRQRQNLELQGLTVLLQNICNDLKNI